MIINAFFIYQKENNMKFEKAQINSTVAKLTAFFDSPEELKKYVDEKEIHSFLI